MNHKKRKTFTYFRYRIYRPWFAFSNSESSDFGDYRIGFWLFHTKKNLD